MQAFISYDIQDIQLAIAWKELLSNTSNGAIDIFVAHTSTEGNARTLPAGIKWREGLMESIQKSEIFIAIITPNTRTSSMMHWETGVASVQNKKIIPITHHMSDDELPLIFTDLNPISGDNIEQVEDFCLQIADNLKQRPRVGNWKTYFSKFAEELKTSYDNHTAKPHFYTLIHLYERKQYDDVVHCYTSAANNGIVFDVYWSIDHRLPLLIHHSLIETKNQELLEKFRNQLPTQIRTTISLLEKYNKKKS